MFQECNNMLYPKEDKENKVLLYACRNCDYKQVIVKLKSSLSKVLVLKPSCYHFRSLLASLKEFKVTR